MDNLLINGLEIMSQDIPGIMTWTSVPNVLLSLGGVGWRLPYEDEFKIIYNLKNLGIGNIKPERYWSFSSAGTKAWYYDLGIGYSPHVAPFTDLYHIRLVRPR